MVWGLIFLVWGLMFFEWGLIILVWGIIFLVWSLGFFEWGLSFFARGLSFFEWWGKVGDFFWEGMGDFFLVFFLWDFIVEGDLEGVLFLCLGEGDCVGFVGGVKDLYFKGIDS